MARRAPALELQQPPTTVELRRRRSEPRLLPPLSEPERLNFAAYASWAAALVRPDLDADPDGS